MIALMGETPQEIEDDVLRNARSVDCCLSFFFCDIDTIENPMQSSSLLTYLLQPTTIVLVKMPWALLEVRLLG